MCCSLFFSGEFSFLLLIAIHTIQFDLVNCNDATKTRNNDPNCNVVLNEFAHSSSEGAFVEIAKVCPPGIPANDVQTLAGFLLLVVDTTTLEVKFQENLHQRKLVFEPFDPTSERPPAVRHSKHSLPKSARTKSRAKATKTKSTTQSATTVSTSTTAAPLLFDHVTTPCSLSFDCYRSRSPRSTLINTTRINRIKRDNRHLQENVRALYLSKLGFSPRKDISYMSILLKLPKNEIRVTKGRENFITGSVLSAAAQQQIKLRMHDYIIVSPSNVFCDQSKIVGLFPDNIPLAFLEFPKKTNPFSLSKCDLSIEPILPEGFIVTDPSPRLRNLCRDYKPGPFRFHGTTMSKQAKKLVANTVITLRDKKNDKEWRKLNEVKAASALLNLHENTVYKIMQEFSTEEDFTSSKARKSNCPVTDIDDGKKQILYKTISSFYKKNEVPYFANIYDKFVKEVNRVQPAQGGAPPYKCSKSSFAKILHKNNYRYGRIQERDAVLFNKNILQRRKKYLELIARYDADPNWNVVYQDETWIDPYARCRKGWVRTNYCDFLERQDFTFANAKVSRGPRIIVLGVGGREGFIPGTSEVWLVSKSKVQADYHGNINGAVFFAWMERVIQALGNKKTVIVIDNSPVHSITTAPLSGAPKAEIQEWMREKLEFETDGYELIPEDFETLTLDRLKQIVKRVKEEYPQYMVDELIKEAGHLAIRLPPYQADLNPIELVWSDLKRIARERNKNQNAKEMLEIAKDIMNTYTAEQWSKHIDHVKRVEAEYRVGDVAVEATIAARPQLEENFMDLGDGQIFDDDEDAL